MKNRSLVTHKNKTKPPKLALYHSISYTTGGRFKLEKLITELNYSLHTLKKATKGEPAFDIYVFYNVEDLVSRKINGVSSRDMSDENFPIKFIQFDWQVTGKELPHSPNVTNHKWHNIDSLWDDYDIVFFVDTDVRWFEDPYVLMNSFFKSQHPVLIGPSHGSKKHVEYSSDGMMMLDFINEKLKRKVRLEKEYYNLFVKNGRRNSGQVMFNTKHWPLKKPFSEEYDSIQDKWNRWCIQKYPAKSGAELTELYGLKGTASGWFTPEERTISIMMALHCKSFDTFTHGAAGREGKGWCGPWSQWPTPKMVPHKEENCKWKDYYVPFHHYYGSFTDVYVPTEFRTPYLKNHWKNSETEEVCPHCCCSIHTGRLRGR
tara:strand:- start:777 stop:1898 length:1122 start_codon:yes stop_codon:yes gene_type:complete